MANVTQSYVETTLVQESDDSLAAAEEAKRTGEPFQSQASGRPVVVPTEIATQVAEEKAQQNTYVGRFGATYAAHLQDWHEKSQDNEYVAQTNEEKARAHAEYSDRFIRARQEEDARIRELQKEGYDVTLAIQEANLRRAQEAQGKADEYLAVRQTWDEEAKSVREVRDEAVEVINTEQLAEKPFEDRVAALSGVVNFEVARSLEKPAEDALKLKDAIVATEVPYEAEVQEFPEVQPKIHPGVEVLEASGSPDELVQSTVDAQFAAGNPRATQAVAEQAPTPESAAEDTSSSSRAPARRRAQAEAKPTAEPVPDAKAADELPEEQPSPESSVQ